MVVIFSLSNFGENGVTFLPGFHPHLRDTHTSDDIPPTTATKDAHPTAGAPTTIKDTNPNIATDDSFITPEKHL